MATVTEQVISEIRERILNGNYGSGAHLHEVTLASDLSVSRTPIRDALRVLANEDLLVYHPNRGYFVQCVEIGDVLDAYDVRGALEGLACRVIAERGMDDAGKAVFWEIVEQGKEILRPSEWGGAQQAAWSELNTRFHQALLEESHNRHLDPIMRKLRFFSRIFISRFYPSSYLFQNIHTREQRLQRHHDHVRIVEAMMHGEGARAEALMREHVYANRELFRSAFEAISNQLRNEEDAAKY